MKAPIPNCRALKGTPLKTVPRGKAPVPAPATPGTLWPKTDAGRRMIASMRTFLVIEIACRFIAFSLFSIVFNDVSFYDGARRTARHRHSWIRNLDLERVIAGSKILYRHSEIKRSAPRTITNAFVAGACEYGLIPGDCESYRAAAIKGEATNIAVETHLTADGPIGLSIYLETE